MKNTILFDLDGTLINSLEDLADGVNYAMTTLDYNKRTLDEVRRFVGNGADMLIKRALPPEGQKDFDTALKLHKKYYNAHLCNKTKPYEGIMDLLEELKKRNYKTAIVTNKPDDAAKLIRDTLFKDSITAVVGAAEGRRKKPEPDQVDYCLKLLDSKRENAVFVGDSEVDVATGKNSGLVTIGVTWGFRDVSVLKGADHIANSADELKKIILKL